MHLVYQFFWSQDQHTKPCKPKWFFLVSTLWNINTNIFCQLLECVLTYWTAWKHSIQLKTSNKNLIYFLLLMFFLFYRFCILTLDEMQLSKWIFYDRKSDSVVGYGTYGKSQNVIASKALVIMLRSLTVRWKQIIGYHFTHSLTGDDIKRLILNVIQDVYLQTGYQVKTKYNKQLLINI